MTDNGPAGHPFSSDEDLCHYVESELGRTIRADRPELYVEFKPPEYSGVADSHLLRWAISSPHMDRSEHLLDRHYLLEARLVEGEFVIWFGKLSGFPLGGGTTRDAILPAVHVPFARVDKRPAYGLGAVLLWMLEHEVEASAVWDPMVYPMNGARY